MSKIVELEVKATSHSVIFRVCMYAMKDTDDVLPSKGDLRCSS